MPTSKLLSLGCLLVVAVLVLPGVGADLPLVSHSRNDVYPADPSPPPPPPTPAFSKARALEMSQTTDLREFIMKYVEDEKICSDPALRDFILAEDGGDERAKVWWSRRCGGRRGGAWRFPSAQSSESTLIRYRRKSSNRDNPQNSLDRSTKKTKKLKKIGKLMSDKRIMCKARRTVVPLPQPGPSGTTMKPECVSIKRCSGCCNSPQLECLPTRTKTRTFPTMELIPKQDRFGVSSNAVTMVKVEEHLSCSCQCKVRAKHCSPSQVYVEDACQCQCPSHLSRSCPSRKTWNEKNCRCECISTRNCTTGRYFDVNTCRCLRP